jgi:hypothetical protein
VSIGERISRAQKGGRKASEARVKAFMADVAQLDEIRRLGT